MSWSNAGSFRNVNPLIQLTKDTNGQRVTLYQPGVLNPGTIKPGITYSGLITNLRAKIQIRSLGLEYVPPPQGDMTPEQYAAVLNQFDASIPKKGLNFYLETSVQPPQLLVQLYMFNRRPFYVVDVLSYFTNSISLDVGSDAKITVQTVNLGFFDLVDDDSVVLWGTAIEEQENATGTFSITCAGGGGGGSNIVNLGDIIGYQGDALAIDGSFANVG